MFGPTIACLKFMGFLDVSNSVSSDSFVSSILKYFGVVVSYFDSNQTFSA